MRVLCGFLFAASLWAQTFEVASVKEFVQQGNGKKMFVFGAVYNLVIAKGGLKMKAVPPGAPRDPQSQRMTIEQIMSLASHGLDRPLIDRTGLTGEFEAKWNLAQMDLDVRDAPDSLGKAAAVLAPVEDASEAESRRRQKDDGHAGDRERGEAP